MDRLFRQSGLMRPKWDELRGESTYGERTIQNALTHCRETFAESTGLPDTAAGDGSASSPEGLPVQGKEPRDSQGTQIVRLAFREGIELFRDEDDTAYIVIPVADHHEVYPLRSKRPRLWLAALFYRETTKAAGSQSIADATNVLEASALQARARPVGVRIMRIGDAIYWDLCDERWRAVEITANGWRVLSRSPVAFKRPKGLQSLPEPARGGSLAELRPFLNLSDDDDFLLVVAFLLGCLRARKPYPILVVNGEQGSAKSTFTTFVRDLIDPNMAPLRSEPTDARDLMIAASNSFLLSYDNLSHIRLADELSRLSTGAGFSTRRLFENGEEEIFAASRPIILNGIPELATKPDLASRAIFLTLPTINSAGRREEAELCAEFSAARPRILGALLDTVVMALNRSADVTLSKRPRMADFAKWVVAAEPAFPWPEVRFLAVYESNRRGAVEAILDGDVIAATVHNLAPWEGTASALLEQVNRQATEDQRRQRGWFKRPRQVRDALCRLAPALREAGINVIVGQKDNTRNRNRIIRLERGVTASSDASITSRDSTLIQDLSGRATDEAPPASAGSSDDSPYFDGALYGEDDADAHSRAHSDSDGGDDE
jgi:hypothetical protein